MHHYPGLTERAIRKMTLKRIGDAIEDIPFVNPHLGTPDGSREPKGPGDENRLSAETSDAQRAQVAQFGGLVIPPPIDQFPQLPPPPTVAPGDAPPD